MKKEKPSFFKKGGWKSRAIEWSMRDESYRIQLLRYIDVLPALRTDALATRLFSEYLGETGSAPQLVQRASKMVSAAGLSLVAAPVIRASVKSLARQFIAGRDPKDALGSLEKLREDGAAVSVDLLGEAVVSDAEARAYTERYLALLDFLAPGFGDDHNGQNRGRLDISLKVSSFYSQMEPLDWDGSVEATVRALNPVLEKARERGVSVTFDMEQYYFKDLLLAVFKKAVAEHPDLPLPGIALQAYLKDTRTDLLQLVDWAKDQGRRISIRLVKGAYWDYETVVNRQKGWPVPVYLHKEETDRNFEELTRILLGNAGSVYPAIATHNLRSISNALALAEELKLSRHDFEFQALYGMDGPVRTALDRASVANHVRVYCPVGELIPGMAYLVRRILENTANESFFRQSFAEGRSFEELLRPPAPPENPAEEPDNGDVFMNEPPTDFSREENRRKILLALTEVKKEFGKKYALHLGGRDVTADRETLSLNPARPDEVVGRISSASKADADRAVAYAKDAFAPWSRTAPAARAEYLFKAAAEMRRRRFGLIALEVYEVGKTVPEADSDVAEAIDYLEYYGRRMIELGRPHRLGRYPGEANDYGYVPRGIGVVIAPWNFPLAIPAGMASAMIVAGNCAILKPSGLSAAIAWQLVDIFRSTGLPPGVLQYLPGPGAEVGEYLVSHREIDVIAFTGSKEVGLRILRLAGEVHPGQRSIKRVIAEMGGKNAIIVDDTADLDEAVRGVLVSSLGYQGQKCSACSRVIVLDRAYEEFSRRLSEAMKSIKIGPPEDFSSFMGPLVDEAAQRKVQAYIERGREEGTVILQRETTGPGYYTGPALFAVSPDAVIAREEIFGPVVSLLRAVDFDEAIALANWSEYALTGGIYSRSPANIEKAKNELRVGNLYINRKITGALVGRQPFGGFGMSGVGSKAGGSDYLLQFLNPKTISENTLRKGVAPAAGNENSV